MAAVGHSHTRDGADMGPLAEPNPNLPTSPEVGTLARELGAAFHDLVECYRHQYKLSAPEALARVEQPVSAEYTENVLRGPVDQVSWHGLSNLARKDPDLAVHRWEEIKREALA